MNRDDRIYVAGDRGLVGSAIVRALTSSGFSKIITRSLPELDLRDQQKTDDFICQEAPKYVFLAAARVGGILANSTFKADFIFDNIAIALNVIKASQKHGVAKLLNLGSSCIYPKLAPQPLREEYLLGGYLEPTNEPYAVAKIAALKLCRYFNEQYGTDFISIMPTNLYGPNDNFDPASSHVLPALIGKMQKAKREGGKVTIWGDGTPRRELLYVDDLARAAIHLMDRFSYPEIGEIVNVGTGEDCSISELAGIIAKAIGYKGEFEYDATMPNGTQQKLLDVSRIHSLGWRANVALEEGISRTYKWFLENVA